jgi:hypothetical protein
MFGTPQHAHEGLVRVPGQQTTPGAARILRRCANAIANQSAGLTHVADLKRVAGRQSAAFEPADARNEVGGPAAHDDRHINAARHRDTGTAACTRTSQHERASARNEERPPHRDWTIIERSVEIGATDCDQRIDIELERGPEQRRLERGHTGLVAHEHIRNAERDGVHRAGPDDAMLLHPRPTGILHRGQQPGPRNADHVSLTATKRTRSPIRSSVGGSSSGRNSRSVVRPMICQPPGVSSG